MPAGTTAVAGIAHRSARYAFNFNSGRGMRPLRSAMRDESRRHDCKTSLEPLRATALTQSVEDLYGFWP